MRGTKRLLAWRSGLAKNTGGGAHGARLTPKGVWSWTAAYVGTKVLAASTGQVDCGEASLALIPRHNAHAGFMKVDMRVRA
ncbi:hypothetical protein HPP92_014476 [Vanilla planifolia]|uniref:Uncharacterized protein n=1 Tax=Vanilla planifolia TaxID=51239 RepID=A0A835QMT2_VANPL|nr:hypothetical protein HPP92_014476 [Vanilla planifolia]